MQGPSVTVPGVWRLIERPTGRVVFAAPSGELPWDPEVPVLARVGDWYHAFTSEDGQWRDRQVVDLGTRVLLIARQSLPIVSGYTPTVSGADLKPPAGWKPTVEITAEILDLDARRTRCALLIPSGLVTATECAVVAKGQSAHKAQRAVPLPSDEARVPTRVAKAGTDKTAPAPRPPEQTKARNVPKKADKRTSRPLDKATDKKASNELPVATAARRRAEVADAARARELAEARRHLHERGHLAFASWALSWAPLPKAFVAEAWLPLNSRKELQAMLDRYEGLQATWALSAGLARELAETRAEAAVTVLRAPLPAVFVRVPIWPGGPTDPVGVHVFEDARSPGVLNCIFVAPSEVVPFYELTRTQLRAGDVCPASDFPAQLTPAWWCIRQVLVAVSRPPMATRSLNQQVTRGASRSISLRRRESTRTTIARPRDISVQPWHLELNPSHLKRVGGVWRWSEELWLAVRDRSPSLGAWVRGHFARFWIRPENRHTDEEVIEVEEGRVAVFRWREAHRRGPDARGDPAYRS